MSGGIEVDLFVEAFGDDDAEPVLLISGADVHCTRWTPALIDPLVAAGFRVVRFDNRDSGLSTKVPSSVGYTLDDLAADSLSVMDGLSIDSAHVIGRSMGGMVGQVLALTSPERVRSLALLCSSPGLGDERLPSAADWLLDKMAERLFAPPPADKAERVAWVVELDRLFAGHRYPFDDEASRSVAELEVERCWYPESGHGPAVGASPSRLDSLGKINVPTLVVHGTADPVFPVEHALALSDGVPGAHLWLVEGLGHEVPDACLPDLLPRLLDHLAD
jgi:pimeloyl-ACP methyl ester carboxylesterase